MKAVIFKKRENVMKLLKAAGSWYFDRIRGRWHPLSCSFYVTSRCSLQCNFCNIWRQSHHYVIARDRAEQFIQDIARMNCYYLSFSGGEPLLVPYLPELISLAKKMGIGYVHLVTNGLLLNDEIVAKLADAHLNEISISIDGDEAFHDSNRGHSGLFRKAVEGIKIIKKTAPQIDIVINSIISPDHIEQAKFVNNLAKELNVKIKYQPLNQHPCFSKNRVHVKRNFEISQKRRFIEFIQELCRDRTVVNSRPFLKNITHYFYNPENLILSSDKCIIGYHHMEIFGDLYVYPCLEALGWHGGFKYCGSLSDILLSADYKNCLKKLKVCNNCKKNMYICYYETRIAFPLGNFLKFSI